jgi:hypothetical protein
MEEKYEKEIQRLNLNIDFLKKKADPQRIVDAIKVTTESSFQDNTSQNEVNEGILMVLNFFSKMPTRPWVQLDQICNEINEKRLKIEHFIAEATQKQYLTTRGSGSNIYYKLSDTGLKKAMDLKLLE